MMEVLNQSKIEKLAREIGEDNVPLLVEIFLGELVAYQQSLTSNELTDKTQYLKDISHALKSSAASFGADKLCAKAVDIDAKAKLGEHFDVRIEAATMVDIINQTYGCYQQLIISSH
ncbi:quorum-sensing phosphorelay protein LuxU [Vibrio ziniensis]|uniref:Phosphorelay protein LuxU n=1 Tax=Vibrio ziniensis TaxID=2711221 RepID=A0A6G7CGK7_9VIBR|nr:quorum-sensing phosphorelay protein LuxU [Vibrio ziniensis]QIH41245.1 Hpt domain-containing protein [Vibrio ziniensis]